MTTKNSILLIIKQNNGISYNALLSKIAPNYSTVNSARAALSRALKDALAFGLVSKQNNSFFITPKGTHDINVEMKNKLILRLNQSICSRNAVEEIDSIIEQLHTMLERSKEDIDLLKAARDSADFYIFDLEQLNQSLSQKISHYSYLSGILSGYIEALKKFNFNNTTQFDFSAENTAKVKKILQNIKEENYFIESNDTELLQQFAAEFNSKVRENNVFLPAASLEKLFEIIQKDFSSNPSKYLTIFFSHLKARFAFPSIQLIAQHNDLEQIIKELEKITL